MAKAPATSRRYHGRSTAESTATAPWTLADGVGLTVLIALTFAWAAPGDSTSVTAMILAVGAFACFPFALSRMRSPGAVDRAVWLPLGATVVLLLWGVTSALASGAPWQTSLYGWFGRSDGLLTLVAVAGLLFAASTLRTPEVDRVVTWLLAGGAIIVVEAMLQLAGSPYPPASAYDGLSAAMGNPNFFAAASAILAVLAIGRALAPDRRGWQRLAAGALAVGLAACSALSLSVQGPVALAIGLVAAGIAWSLQHRGRGRPLALTLSALILAVGVIGLALTVLKVGPFSVVREAQTIGYREVYWEAAWRMMAGLPLFGSGPDGFARYVARFRTEDYLAAPGSQIRVSAAHDVPIQYGATMGVIGALAWLVLMVGTGILLLRMLLRGVERVWLVVSLIGAWTAYVAQSLISIDAPNLKALGWTLTGLAIAMATKHRAQVKSKRPAWLPGVAVALGGLAVIAWWPTLSATSQAASASSVEVAAASAASTSVPCPMRQDLLVALARSIPVSDLARVARSALDADPRCPSLAAIVGEVALQAGDLQEARSAAEIAVETDPLAPGSWFILSLVLKAEGDEAGASEALSEAQRLAAIDPSDTLDQALTETPTPAPASP